MPWFKVDDGFHSHAKAITAGTAALGLWVRCGSWSAHHLTDGLVPANVAREFGSASQIKALVASGLWLAVDTGFQFNDFTEYNPTSMQVLTDREAAKERQRKAREAAKAKRDAARSSGEVTDLSRRDEGVSHAPVTVPPTRPDPTRPEGSKEPSKPQSRKTATPDIFPITDKMRSWAADSAPGVDLERETDRFLSNHRSKGNRFIDWGQAWRTWMTTPYPKIMLEGGSAPAERRSETAKKFG